MTCRNSFQLWNSAILDYLVCYLIPTSITFKKCQEHTGTRTCMISIEKGKKIETIWSWKMSTLSKYLLSFKMKVHVGLTTGFFFVRIFWIIQKSVWKSYRCLPSTKCFAWRYWIGSREREWTQSYYETICSSAISRNQYQIPAS